MQFYIWCDCDFCSNHVVQPLQVLHWTQDPPQYNCEGTTSSVGYITVHTDENCIYRSSRRTYRADAILIMIAAGNIYRTVSYRR